MKSVVFFYGWTISIAAAKEITVPLVEYYSFNEHQKPEDPDGAGLSLELETNDFKAHPFCGETFNNYFHFNF